MVLGLGGDLGDRLIRNKLQYNYDWISQPQAMTEDGKQIFRDEKGYPKAVFDPATKTWLTPEQADVTITLEKWIEAFTGGIYIGHFGGMQYETEDLFNGNKFIILENPSEIMSLPAGTEIMILNPSGEITVWVNPDEAVKRIAEGAIIIAPNSNTQNHPSIDLATKYALISAFKAWEKDKNSPIHVQFDEKDTGRINSMMIFIDEIPYTTDANDRIICPILEIPKYFSVMEKSMSHRSDKAGVTDPVYWLDELISQGYLGITVYANQERYDWAFPPDQ